MHYKFLSRTYLNKYQNREHLSNISSYLRQFAVITEDASKVTDDGTSSTAEEANISVKDCSSNSSTATNRLMIIELDKKDTLPMETSLPSPIVQLDGEAEENIARFSFESTYHDDDIRELLSEIFPESEVNLTK